MSEFEGEVANLRVFLAQRGLKKGDMSPTDLQTLIDEASNSIKNEIRHEFEGKTA